MAICKVKPKTGCADIDVNFSTGVELNISIPESVTSDELSAKIKNQKTEDLKFVTDAIEDQWKKNRMTGDDVANVLSQVIPSVLSQSTDNAIKQRELLFKEAQLKLELETLKLKAIEELKQLELLDQQILESKAKIELYNKQAESFRDRTKLDATKILVSGWTSLYTQNALEDIPLSFLKAQVDDTLDKLFQDISFGTASTAND